MIALDAYGADAGVDVVIRGSELSGLQVRVFGPPLIAIGNEEEPARAVRSRADASIVTAARAVGAGEADALVSAGPTGATLAAAVLHIKRIRGVHRPGGAAPPGGRGPPADPGRPADAAAGRGRQRRGAARAPRAVRIHGRHVHGGGA